MTVTPQGQIYLCKTPLESNYKNQITFANLNTQASYFNTTVQKSFTDYTYIKHDNTVKVSENIDNIIDCNYLFYRNIGFSNKTYYCFITSMTYVNENVTLISFETDVFQTYQFDITYNPCFVEREHVNNDTVGLHTVPENLETGEFIVNSVVDDNISTSNRVIVLASTIDPSIDSKGELVGGVNGGGIYGGVLSGYKFYTFDPAKSTIKNVLKAFADKGKIDAIGYMFMAPRNLVVPDLTIDIDNYMVPDFTTPPNLVFDVSKQTTINGYTPINKKLLCYPYNYMMMTNNSGATSVYKYEDFSTSTCEFRINSVVTASMSTILIPLSYKGVNYNYSESMSGGKFPICGYQNDTFTNWLTQNGINIAYNVVGSTISTVGGAFSSIAGAITGNPMMTLGGLGSTVSGLSQISNVINTTRNESLVPVQAEGNTNIGDVVFAINKIKFSAYRMSIKEEYARIIDNYFSMFGYKIARIKVPNITGRQNWNYVKTIDCNFTGDNIPDFYLETIRTIFNNGITLWHNPTNMYNYNASNSIVTS